MTLFVTLTGVITWKEVRTMAKSVTESKRQRRFTERIKAFADLGKAIAAILAGTAALITAINALL